MAPPGWEQGGQHFPRNCVVVCWLLHLLGLKGQGPRVRPRFWASCRTGVAAERGVRHGSHWKSVFDAVTLFKELVKVRLLTKPSGPPARCTRWSSAPTFPETVLVGTVVTGEWCERVGSDLVTEEY